VLRKPMRVGCFRLRPNTSVHIKLRSDGADLRLAGVHDERACLVLGDLKQRLAFEQIDVALVIAVPDADFGASIELDERVAIFATNDGDSMGKTRSSAQSHPLF
jgi:hypothetical protein